MVLHRVRQISHAQSGNELPWYVPQVWYREGGQNSRAAPLYPCQVYIMATMANHHEAGKGGTMSDPGFVEQMREAVEQRDIEYWRNLAERRGEEIEGLRYSVSTLKRTLSEHRIRDDDRRQRVKLGIAILRERAHLRDDCKLIDDACRDAANYIATLEAKIHDAAVVLQLEEK